MLMEMTLGCQNLKHIASMNAVGHLQDDLNTIIWWSKENDKQLQEDHFKLPPHQDSSNNKLYTKPVTATVLCMRQHQ